MSERLQFELVTPEKLAVSEVVAMVEVPGEMGDFGVLPGHAPFLSMVRPGVITVHQDESKKTRYFVPSGYAEVNPEGCIVLAEHIRDLADISKEQATQELEHAQNELKVAKEGAEKEYAQQKVDLAETVLATL